MVTRLKRYAEGLGAKVVISDSEPYRVASDISLDGRIIRIYKHKTKIGLVLSLVHELGHLLEHINNHRVPCVKIESALRASNLTIEQRRLIFADEIAGTTWWDVVISDCELKIKPERIEFQKIMDMWIYQVWAETGEWPTSRMDADKRRRLKGGTNVENWR